MFSLLGTQYGGDGRTTFGLPDLRGRAPIGAGQGPGLSNRSQGEAGGVEMVTLTPGQLPPHGHRVAAASEATAKSPADAVPAYTADGSTYGSGTDLSMSAAMVSGGGSGQPHENMQPYLATNWCIAIDGIYPSRP